MIDDAIKFASISPLTTSLSLPNRNVEIRRHTTRFASESLQRCKTDRKSNKQKTTVDQMLPEGFSGLGKGDAADSV